jgi:putative intracellular protease/amidase
VLADALADRERAEAPRRDYVHGLWRGFPVRDGNLITGQQNFSGPETADLLAATLGV